MDNGLLFFKKQSVVDVSFHTGMLDFSSCFLLHQEIKKGHNSKTTVEREEEEWKTRGIEKRRRGLRKNH
jgi:hypothetical protein